MKVADYSQAVTADQLDAALRAGGFDGVFHYFRGTPGWIRRVELAGVVAAIREKGWPQLGIDLPLNPADADGELAAQDARAYGFPPGSLLALDIEPARFVLDRAGWARAAEFWCEWVRAGGFSPGVYGTDETVAACSNQADWIWRAKPGQCDPAGPGLAAAFFAGRRIVQCGAGVVAGVEFDISYSQFPVEVDMTPDQAQQLSDVYAIATSGSFAANQEAPPPGSGQGQDPWLTLQIKALTANVDLLLAGQKPIDIDALASALATHLPTAADPHAVAAEVIRDLATQLNKP